MPFLGRIANLGGGSSFGFGRTGGRTFVKELFIEMWGAKGSSSTIQNATHPVANLPQADPSRQGGLGGYIKVRVLVPSEHTLQIKPSYTPEAQANAPVGPGYTGAPGSGFSINGTWMAVAGGGGGAAEAWMLVSPGSKPFSFYDFVRDGANPSVPGDPGHGKGYSAPNAPANIGTGMAADGCAVPAGNWLVDPNVSFMMIPGGGGGGAAGGTAPGNQGYGGSPGCVPLPVPAAAGWTTPSGYPSPGGPNPWINNIGGSCQKGVGGAGNIRIAYDTSGGSTAGYLPSNPAIYMEHITSSNGTYSPQGANPGSPSVMPTSPAVVKVTSVGPGASLTYTANVDVPVASLKDL